MSASIASRPRGRPRLHASPLCRERILAVAAQSLAAGSGDISMRAIATALDVNVMALYHYFSDKQALRAALVEHAFAPLFRLSPRLAALQSPEPRLKLLARVYLQCAARALPLTRHLAGRGGVPLAERFSSLLDEALGASARQSADRHVSDVLVDYLNGAALAGPRHSARALEAGWPVLMAGIRQQIHPESRHTGKDIE